MKFDIELARAILLAVSNHDEPLLHKIEIDGYPPLYVDYHVDLLGKDGYLTGQPYKSSQNDAWGGIKWVNVGLSMKGHVFIDDASNENVWRQVKQDVAEKGGNVSLTVISGLVLSYAKQAFGL